MADSFLAWSHSRRKMWKECPKQLFHNAVAKKGDPAKIEFQQTPAMLAGVEVDDALTARIANGTPLPVKFAPYEGVAAAVLAAPGIKYTQLRVALDQAFKPCGYMSWGETWLRAVYDAAVINKEHAFIFDWKNGTPWPDDDQLKLFAATAFHTFPELEKVDVSYVWLRHGVTSDAKYTRKQLPEMWSELLPEVERMQVAYKTQHWPALPKDGKKTCGRCGVNAKGLCAEAHGPYVPPK